MQILVSSMKRMACASERLAQVGQPGLLAIRQRLELAQRADQPLDRRPAARAEDDPVPVALAEHFGQAFEPEGFDRRTAWLRPAEEELASGHDLHSCRFVALYQVHVAVDYQSGLKDRQHSTGRGK